MWLQDVLQGYKMTLQGNLGFRVPQIEACFFWVSLLKQSIGSILRPPVYGKSKTPSSGGVKQT